MTSPALRFVVALVRGWTRLYTSGQEPAVRDARRAEIESDLWELQHDGDGDPVVAPAAHVLARLLLGVPDDLSWRYEQAGTDSFALRRAVAYSVAAIVVMTAVALVPPRLQRGMPGDGTAVMACTNEPLSFQSSTEVRLRIMKCAGAFFPPRRPGPPPHTER
jgi:hypothetical protein